MSLQTVDERSRSNEGRLDALLRIYEEPVRVASDGSEYLVVTVADITAPDGYKDYKMLAETFFSNRHLEKALDFTLTISEMNSSMLFRGDALTCTIPLGLTWRNGDFIFITVYGTGFDITPEVGVTLNMPQPLSDVDKSTYIIRKTALNEYSVTQLGANVGVIGGSSYLVPIANMAALRLTSLTGSIDLLGYSATTDGGEGTFLWDTTSTEADNDGTIIKVTAVVTGRWKRVYEGEIHLKWFGLTADGVADDKTKFLTALLIGGKIDMDGLNVGVNGGMATTTDFEVYNGSIVQLAALGDITFQNTAQSASIHDVNFSGHQRIFKQLGNFKAIELYNIEFTGLADVTDSYVIDSTADITGETVRIENLTTYDASLGLLDDIQVVRIEILRNKCYNPPRWGFRSLHQVTVKKAETVIIHNNEVYDINGNLTDKTNVARCWQISASKITYVTFNQMDGAESDNSTNFVYSFWGSLVVANNSIKALKGLDSRAIIDDKAIVATSEYFWDIHNNVIDQTGILLADTPECGVKINEAKNVHVHHNTFIGLTCFAVRVYHSVDTGNYPENIRIDNNTVIDSLYPVAFQVFQNIINTVISNNNVVNIDNPTSISVSARTDVRVVDVYQTFNNGLDLSGVIITGNTIQSPDAIAYILTLYRNAVAVTSDITGVKVINNLMLSSASGAFVRFTGTGAAAIDIVNNVAEAGTSNNIGTAPAGTRIVNNLIV